jgi:hypothetical protein
VAIPSRRAVAATLGRPTTSASCAATVLTDCASAVSSVMGPRKVGSKSCGDQPLIVTGWSMAGLSGVSPVSIAVR